jgi:hypothetical protein
MSRALRFFRLSAVLFCLGFVLPTRAAEFVTDRDDWSLLVDTMSTEDFDLIPEMELPSNVITTIGALDFYVDVPARAGGVTRIDLGTSGDSRVVNGTTYMRLGLDGTPKRTVTVTFPEPVYGVGFDYRSSAPFTDPGNFDAGGESSDFGGAGTAGFIGFVSATSFTTLTLTDPFSSSTVFGLDDLSYATALASPVILGPADGEIYYVGETLDFSGLGLDPLTWASDRDGTIGIGSSLTGVGLALGFHTIYPLERRSLVGNQERGARGAREWTRRS